MNTVERVARAISGAPFPSERSKKKAQAALNALVDGLEWRGRHLFLNGREIGSTYASGFGYRYYLISEESSYAYDTWDAADEALMTAARKWLMGDND